MNKAITLALAALVLVSITGMVQVKAQQQTTITTTTTTQHQWNPNHWLWRHGFEHPFGLFQGNNVVTVPAVILAQTVVNTCPHLGDLPEATVQLSTGQCLTPQQAIYEIQTGQIQVGGQVQALGQVIVGTPTVLGIQGFADPFVFFHQHHAFNHAIHEAQEQSEQSATQTTP